MAELGLKSRKSGFRIIALKHYASLVRALAGGFGEKMSLRDLEARVEGQKQSGIFYSI